jgi:hypothetical protein
MICAYSVVGHCRQGNHGFSLSLERPLASHLDAIRKEFHAAVARNVHVTKLAVRSVQSSKTKGLAWD